MLFTLIVCTTLFVGLYLYFTRTFNYWQRKNVKGPKPIPFFGNYLDVALRKQHLGMLYWDLYKEYPEEKVVGLYRMTSPTLLIRDLDIAKQVLFKDFDVFPDRATYFSKEGLGENLFHADFETWKRLRHRFTSAFTTNKIKGIFNQVEECGDKFTDYIESATIKKPEQDVYQMVLKYTVGTVMAAIFGLNIDTFSNDIKLFEIIDEKLENNFLNEMEMVFPGILMKFYLSLISDEVIKFCHQIVEAGIQIKSSTPSGITNIMDLIMNLKKEGDTYVSNPNIDNNKETLMNSSNDLLAAQAWVFYTAGYANNTLLLTYAMYRLSRNPEVQDKLRKEITEVMEKYNGTLSYEALKEMKYLDLVFEETLRMHPLTNGLVRSVSQDIKIEGVDLTINKGSVVVVSPYSIQHDEKYYPEPEIFNPERFLPENAGERHPCAFLSFGVGRRSCLGSQISKIMFKVCVAKVLSKFRVETSENTISSIRYNPRRMLLTPEQKIYLNFVPC